MFDELIRKSTPTFLTIRNKPILSATRIDYLKRWPAGWKIRTQYIYIFLKVFSHQFAIIFWKL